MHDVGFRLRRQDTSIIPRTFPDDSVDMAFAVPIDSLHIDTTAPPSVPGEPKPAVEPVGDAGSSPQVAIADTDPLPTTHSKSPTSDKAISGGPEHVADDKAPPVAVGHTAPEAPTPAAPTPTPSKRRPNPPSKGILKPPPPPAKPSLGNRLRDIVTVVGGGAKSLFEGLDESQNNPNGPHTAGPSTPQAQGIGSGGAVGGALNALSGRIGLGFSRLVASASPGSPAASATGSIDVTPTGSPGPSRSLSLPDARASVDKGKRRDLKRATFLLPSLSITYPISSQGEPWSEKVLLERQKVSLATP